MPQTINVPGVGQLQFPDGMSQPEMAAAIQKNFPQIHAPSAADQIPGGGLAGNRNVGKPDDEPGDNLLGKIYGAIEPAIAMGTGMVGGAVGSLAGVGKSIVGGKFGTLEGMREGEQFGGKVADALTYSPRTATGQALTQKAGELLHDSGIVGVPIPEIEALGRSLPLSRARISSPVGPAVEPVSAVDYDIPAYQRNGTKPPPEVAGPPIPTAEERAAADAKVVAEQQAIADQEAQARAAEAAAKVVPVPDLPPATPRKVIRSPLDAYATNPINSPFGELVEPVAPQVALTPLEAAAQAKETAPVVPRNQFDDILRENPAPVAPKSPLESMIAGENLPAAKITAPLRDTSDIDAMLAKFGVSSSEPPTVPMLPIEQVEQATIPASPLDASLTVPERIPSPLSSETVPRATEPAAPIDSGMVAPEPTAPTVTPEAESSSTPTPQKPVNPADAERNLQVLRDIGLDNIRRSAVEGDAATAAREFQHGKITSEPAGQHWFDQFQSETQAMKNYVQRIIDKTGGRIGLDSDSLEAKGRVIAAPYDAARDYFEKAKKGLYDEADKEMGGQSLKSTSNIEKLLDDKEFNNTALADKNLDLVQAVKQQFDLHKERNGGALTVKEAEQFRKWLNKRWNPANSSIIGAIKDALDEDVFSSAGKDVYAAARKMHQDEMRALDNPNGIAKIMDSDPYTPVNRNTPYEQIPNAMIKLSNEQFKHIIDTYQQMPPALKPLVDQALATLKAHYAERILDAGAETAANNPRQLWNTGGVRKIASDNSAKLPLLFDATDMQALDTLLQAGEILRVNPQYPGAAAQLANASKAGMMSNLLGKAGAAAGGGLGAIFGGPPGAVAGAAGGEVAASALLRRSGERKALSQAKEAIINEHRAAPQQRAKTPVEEYEDAVRQGL